MNPQRVDGPPAAGTQAVGPQPFWRNGPYLVVRTDVDLPPRCIKCNRAAAVRVRKRVYWSDAETEAAGGRLAELPWFDAVFAFISMFRWLGSLRTFRSPVVYVHLCRRHRLALRLQTALAYLVFPASICVWLAPTDVLVRIWVPVTGFFVSAILWARPRPVKAVHVGVGHVTLAGLREAFLNSLEQPPPSAAPSIDSMLSATESLKAGLAARRGQRPPEH